MPRLDQHRRGLRRKRAAAGVDPGALARARELIAEGWPWAEPESGHEGIRGPLFWALRRLVRLGPNVREVDPALGTGTDWLSGLTLEGARDLWRALGYELTVEHARRRPGTRPWAWWKWEAPEDRRTIAGALHFPTITGRRYPDGLSLDGTESQADYLARLDLLLPGEAEAIAQAQKEAR